jgi:pilus assembly protein Flp/PilA
LRHGLPWRFLLLRTFFGATRSAWDLPDRQPVTFNDICAENFSSASTKIFPQGRQRDRVSSKRNTQMTLVNFIRDEQGVTAIEYGLIAALIAVAIIIALTSLGQSLESNFNEVASALDKAV